MRSLFNPDGPVLAMITKIVYSVWLNILWFLCCIPIITIGPATTALFYTCQKIVLDEEGYLTKAYFHSFRQNFKQSTAVGLIMTALGVFLAVDGYVFYHMRSENAFWTILTAVYFVVIAVYLMISMYIYPLLAHFDNTLPAMFKNAAILSLRFLFLTVFMAVIYFAMLVLVVRIFTPAIIFGMGTCALFCSMLMKRVLIMLEPSEAADIPEA